MRAAGATESAIEPTMLEKTGSNTKTPQKNIHQADQMFKQCFWQIFGDKFDKWMQCTDVLIFQPFLKEAFAKSKDGLDSHNPHSSPPLISQAECVGAPSWSQQHSTSLSSFNSQDSICRHKDFVFKLEIMGESKWQLEEMEVIVQRLSFCWTDSSLFPNWRVLCYFVDVRQVYSIGLPHATSILLAKCTKMDG